MTPPEASLERPTKGLPRPLVQTETDAETGELRRFYNLYDYQSLSLELSDSFSIVCMAGSVQNGKSIAGLCRLVKYITHDNPSPPPGVERVIWIVIPDRHKYWEALKPKIEYVFGFADEGGLIVDRNLSKPSYSLRAADEGPPWECFIVSVKDPDTARSATICAALMSEAGLVDEKAFDNIMARLAARNGPLFIESSPFGLNWFWKRVVNNGAVTYVYKNGQSERLDNPKGDSRIAVIRGVKITDNKAMDEKVIAALRAGMAGETAKRELDGEFFQWEGLVWKGFKPLPAELGGNLILPPTEKDFGRDGKYGTGWYVFSGMDFGFDHPFAHVWVARKGQQRIVLDEYEQAGETLKTHSENIRSNLWNRFSEYRYRDPSGAQAASDLSEFKVHSEDATNDVEPGLDCVARLFESGNLLISTSCRKLIEAIGNYHRDDKTGRPVKIGDDLPDALRYALYTDELMGGPSLPHYSMDSLGNMSLQSDDPEYFDDGRTILNDMLDAADNSEGGKEVI